MNMGDRADLATDGRPRVGLVLWNGDIGGAEVLTLSLARRLRQLGCRPTILFIQEPGALGQRIEVDDVPVVSMGMRRGRDILRHPRRYAGSVARHAPDGALLVECGFMGAALRAGGYEGTIVAAEHGASLMVGSRSVLRRGLWRLARAAGAWADDVEVGVSDFTLQEMRKAPHTERLVRIHNGVEMPGTRPAKDPSGPCRIGFAARLVSGKGGDHLLQAIARMETARPLQLRIAGDGPELEGLVHLAGELGISDRVLFLGLVHDMTTFWSETDLAVVPSAEFTESCPMTPLEAMAAETPVVATRNGGLVELVVDGLTGRLVSPGRPEELSAALAGYVEDEPVRERHGRAGRARVEEHFSMATCAASYMDLFLGLPDTARRRSPVTETSSSASSA